MAKNLELYDNLASKIQDSISTEHEVNFNYFMPVYKVSGNSVLYKEFIKNGSKLIIKNEYGQIEIRNRILTEYHLKIFNSIMYCGIVTKLKDGNIGVYFDEKEVLDDLGMKTNHTKFRETVKQIDDAKYYLKLGKITKSCGIISNYYTSHETDSDKSLIILDKDYVHNHELDFGVNYKEIYKKIAGINYYTIPSIVRWFLITQKNSNVQAYKLDNVLKEIGFPVNSVSSMKEIKSNLKKYADALKEDYGIHYNHKTKEFKYSAAKNIQHLKFDMEKSLLQFKNKKILYDNETREILDITGEGSNWKVKTDKGVLEYSVFCNDLMTIIENMIEKESERNLLE